MRIGRGEPWARVPLAGIAAVVAGVLLVGCSSDAPVAPTSASGARADLAISLAAQPQASIIIEPPVRQRFGPIRIDAVSAIRVGTPVRFEVSADVNIPTARAQVQLEVPEITEIAYRATHGLESRGRRNPGVQLFWRGAAPKGPGQIRQGVSVVFPRARAVLRARLGRER